MREENYFEKKLETCKDTLVMAKGKIEHLDLQILKLKERFDHDMKVYNDQTIHMQNIVKDMEKRIPQLEKKLKEGYTTIDMRTGKEYKSFKDRHIAHLKEKIVQAEENEKLIEKKQLEKAALRLKKREKLSEEEEQIVIAEEIRESLQPKDEIEEIYQTERERLEEKKAFYKAKLAELTGQPPEEPKVEIPLPEPTEEEEELKEEQIKVVKEVKEIVNNKMKELVPGKAKCPECGEYFTKGGAFVNHYNSHFNGPEELDP